MLDRRSFLGASAVLTMSGMAVAAHPNSSLLPLADAVSGAPALGLAGATVFDVDLDQCSACEQAERAQLINMATAGDPVQLEVSAERPRSIRTVSQLLSRAPANQSVRLAVQLWADSREAAEAQLQRAWQQLGHRKFDLVQISLRAEWQAQLALLRNWQAEERIRRVGLIVRHVDQYAAVEAAMQAGLVDAIRVNYSLAERSVEQRLLPAAQAHRIMVLAARPFSGGTLLQGLQHRALPRAARANGINSWAQLLLRYPASHPAVTTVLSSMTTGQQLLENQAALKVADAAKSVQL